MPRAYTFDGVGQTKDIGSWQLWWDLKKDLYLQLDTINALGTRTVDGEFYLGHGQQLMKARGGRATNQEVRTEVLPALYEAISKGGIEQFSIRAMLSIAKSSRGIGASTAEFLFRNFLPKPYIAEDRAAALSLGILERDQAYSALYDLCMDTTEGREINGRQNVDHETRSFAVYGLGLLGGSSSDPGLREQIVKDLVHILEQKKSHDDLKTAAMISLGLIPMQSDESVINCVCGECAIDAPQTSLQAQLTYLTRFLSDEAKSNSELRSHTATTLGRLMNQQDENEVFDEKTDIAEYLIKILDGSRRAPQKVRESCVLALGLIGDADNDEIDQLIRFTLERAVHGSYLERRFAFVSLGQVGSRPGSGEEPYGATNQARNFLNCQALVGQRYRSSRQVTPARWHGSARVFPSMAIALLFRGVAQSMSMRRPSEFGPRTHNCS